MNAVPANPPSWQTCSNTPSPTWSRTSKNVRQALALGKISLLGHSYGGALAQAYALKYQQNLSHLILGSTFASTKELNAALAKMKSEMSPKIASAWTHSKPPVYTTKANSGNTDAIPRSTPSWPGASDTFLTSTKIVPTQLRSDRLKYRHRLGCLPRNVGLARRVRSRRQSDRS